VGGGFGWVPGKKKGFHTKTRDILGLIQELTHGPPQGKGRKNPKTAENETKRKEMNEDTGDTKKKSAS